MNASCELPEQTASYAICLNDDVIMEGVPVVTNTNSCQRIPKQVQEKIQKNDIYYDNQVVTSFDEYYQLLLQNASYLR